MSTCSKCNQADSLRGNHLFIRISDKIESCLSPELCKDQCKCRVPIYCLPCVKSHRLEGKEQKRLEHKQQIQERVKQEKLEMKFDQQSKLERRIRDQQIHMERIQQLLTECKSKRQPLVDSIIQTLNQLSSYNRPVTQVSAEITLDDVSICFNVSQTKYYLNFTYGHNLKVSIGYQRSTFMAKLILNTTYQESLLNTHIQIQTYITHLFAILPF
jgi:hypothetical protein